jgi:class 3 adenylate cyclase/pimeloyl-ACP methyl ester carboxylesterase
VEGNGVNELPVTRYAAAPDGVSVAYQVWGSGPLNVVLPTELGVPIDLLWETPAFVRVARRLERFCRVVLLELRGIGASGGDYLDSVIEEIGDGDLEAVMDASECAQAVLVGSTNGGPVVIQFAVRHPDRVTALILVNTYAHYIIEHDYPYGFSLQVLDDYAAQIRQHWSTGEALHTVAPSKVGDDTFLAWWTRSQRLGVGPDQSVAVGRAAVARDVRPLLAKLSVPTLVLHRRGSRYIHVGAGRYLAEHIPDAKYVELSGEDQLFFVGDTDGLVDEIEEFLTGVRPGAEGDVATATILFTDIVASTEHQAQVGPRGWSQLTDHHDAMVRTALLRHQGREVRTTGDGFLATFGATGRAIHCAAEILASAKDIGLDLRAGVHTGEVERRGDDIAGLAVNIAKRVCDLAGPGQVLVSETVRGHMVGSGIVFDDGGEHQLKGVPGTWRLFTVVG